MTVPVGAQGMWLKASAPGSWDSGVYVQVTGHVHPAQSACWDGAGPDTSVPRPRARPAQEPVFA